jgi:hypothetical protein
MPFIAYNKVKQKRKGNNTMKKQILAIINKAGANGIRRRDIGAKVGVWHIDCLDAILDLEKEGRVFHKAIGSGWETYIKYYPA